MSELEEQSARVAEIAAQYAAEEAEAEASIPVVTGQEPFYVDFGNGRKVLMMIQSVTVTMDQTVGAIVDVESQQRSMQIPRSTPRGSAAYPNIVSGPPKGGKTMQAVQGVRPRLAILDEAMCSTVRMAMAAKEAEVAAKKLAMHTDHNSITASVRIKRGEG